MENWWSMDDTKAASDASSGHPWLLTKGAWSERRTKGERRKEGVVLPTACWLPAAEPAHRAAFGRWHFATFVHPGALHLPACAALTQGDCSRSCHEQVRQSWFSGFLDSILRKNSDLQTDQYFCPRDFDYPKCRFFIALYNSVCLCHLPL